MLKSIVRASLLEIGLAVIWRPAMIKLSPFRCFKKLPEIIRVAVCCAPKLTAAIRMTPKIHFKSHTAPLVLW
jgi:hypothetical protein